ncbi:hypothetical protein V1478_000379 [Vespula squamosa]|uniref:Uncharacterized protein n=1 Tax=Vespula squamosa TaxID=30214 RepID=A0ABD2C7E0_VESSQ
MKLRSLYSKYLSIVKSTIFMVQYSQVGVSSRLRENRSPWYPLERRRGYYKTLGLTDPNKILLKGQLQSLLNER